MAGGSHRPSHARSMRLKTVAELMDLMGKPVPEQVLMTSNATIACCSSWAISSIH